jgi:hypothetical protein
MFGSKEIQKLLAAASSSDDSTEVSAASIRLSCLRLAKERTPDASLCNLLDDAATLSSWVLSGIHPEDMKAIIERNEESLKELEGREKTLYNR